MSNLPTYIGIATSKAVREGDIVIMQNGVFGIGISEIKLLDRMALIKRLEEWCGESLPISREAIKNEIIRNSQNNLDAVELLHEYGLA